MYMAWLCYPSLQMGDDLDQEPEIKFEEPERWRYSKIIPIQFSVLHQWSDKDKELYR
jgi:hypothetical protein